MALNQQIRSRAIKGFEARLKALTSQKTYGYPIHIEKNWVIDIRTILAILRDDPKKTELIKNLPE